MSNSCFNSNQARGGNKSWGCPPSDPVGTPFLFDLDKDQGEYCDLYAALPEIAAEMLRRLDAYTTTEVPVRFPSPDPRLNPGNCKPPIDFWFAREEKWQNGSLVCGR